MSIWIIDDIIYAMKLSVKLLITTIIPILLIFIITGLIYSKDVHDRKSFLIVNIVNFVILAIILIANYKFLILRRLSKVSKHLDEYKNKLDSKVGERVKEFACLHALSELIQKHSDIEIILKELLKIIPMAWSHPDITCCSIRIDSSLYRSNNFELSKWILRQEIRISGFSRGSIKVLYKDERPQDHEGPFTREERSLLNILAQRIERTIEFQQSQDRLKLVLEGTGLGLWDWNPQTNQVIFDEQWAKMLGYKSSEIKPSIKSWEEKVHPDDLDDCYSDIRKHMQGEVERYQNIHRMKHKDGRWLYVWDRGKIVEKDSSGEPIRFTRTHTDITEQKNAEIKILESMKTKEQFFALMNHEIRNPLNALIGALEIMKEDIQGDEHKQLFQIAEESSSLLKTTVDDILEFYKSESNKLSIELIPFHLHDIIDSATRLFREQCATKGLIFSSKIKPSPLWLRGDPHRIKQVINNLISNSVKFTDQGHIVLSSEYKDDFLYIKVKDTGIGISEENITNLFSPYAQAEISTTRKYGGTGLGLYLSKEICKLMGGNLSVESKLNNGSAFTATFKLQKCKAPEKIEVKVKEKITFSQEESLQKILIVDDSKENRALMSIKLKKAGLKNLAFAENGQEAIDYFNKNDCKLILMDCMMPIKNGFQAATEIKAKTNNLPILALTANLSDEIIARCKNAGMDDFHSKPVDFDMLFEFIKKHIS